MNAEIFDGNAEWYKSEYIKEYINKHSNGKLKSVQKLSKIQSLKQLHEKLKNSKKDEATLEWEKIKDLKIRVDFESFKSKYPKFFEKEVNEKLDMIFKEEELKQTAEDKWKKIQDSKDKIDFEEYRKDFPSFYINEVKAKIEEINIKEAKILGQKKQQENAKKNAQHSRNSISNSFLKNTKKKDRKK